MQCKTGYKNPYLQPEECEDKKTTTTITTTTNKQTNKLKNNSTFE